MTENLLIGKEVQYSITKETTALGKVLGVERIQTNLASDAVVTGYLIQDANSNILRHIAYWRIIKVTNNSMYQQDVDAQFQATKDKSLNKYNTDHSNDLGTNRVVENDDLPF